MELFAVFAINAVVSVVLYYTITSKVTERIRTHMLKKINEEIRDFVDELETESLRQVDLIGSRILTFKEMTLKAEELVRRIEQAAGGEVVSNLKAGMTNSESQILSRKNSALQNPQEKYETAAQGSGSKIPGSIQQGIGHIYKENLELNQEDEDERDVFISGNGDPVPVSKNKSSSKQGKTSVFSSEERIQSSFASDPGKFVGTPAPNRVAKQNSRGTNPIPTTSGSTSNLVLETIGKGVRKFFGIQEIKTIAEETDKNDYFPGTRNSTLDISLDEDPFAPEENENSAATGASRFTDNRSAKEANFGRILNDTLTGYEPQRSDSAKISAESVLLEIAEDASKIEKVVFLLKRKYSHEEISEVLDLALGEVDIIERFRLDRNRRF
ncbi:hypothetical protein EHQ12_08915 [Leptospira gomenensis]|uniref:Uncharacterized protein n=1 Tax=Leptospira gomenensis TaxID=2484974 RepID=A0A5F1YGK6_9LEPT|nr:hypothetical protein [Leptospira gomenensis]TGK37559.1 hypothetical protein EHQ17_03140 [Leptospira gomenensis]TGK39435.1 hypothetical protein EHQ12_08915 [Leptospira gomenensis]TGK43143.1 hypothetical protein EHQ07_13435 [Leptospira gomenensis]TGK55028.1 hypothetical protein EHQ13_17775 [Leptospira gomenensis]